MTPFSSGPQQAPSLAGRRVLDVAVVGGGIIGTAAAAFLGEAGLSVGLFERADIGAGASGRNSGVVQRPFDPELADLHERTIALYRELTALGFDFELGPAPAGLLLISTDATAVDQARVAVAGTAPDLRPELLDPAVLSRLEPALAPGLFACRLETGYPVAPAAATRAFAERARRAGVAIELDCGEVTIVADDGAARAIRYRDTTVACGTVLVAAGPWSPRLIPGWAAQPPIRPVWGVVATVTLPAAPRHVLEELGIDRPGHPPEELFSLVTAQGASSVGSTFLADEPSASERVGRLLERAQAFVPALAGTAIDALRVCARPVTVDGRPITGRVAGYTNLFVCAGHGPWGISAGPASAHDVVGQILASQAPREAMA